MEQARRCGRGTLLVTIASFLGCHQTYGLLIRQVGRQLESPTMNHDHGTLVRSIRRVLIASLMSLGPASYSTAQSITFYPIGDTLSLWGTCTPPGVIWHSQVDSTGLDRIVIHRYTCELIHGFPPDFITARFDSAYFTVRDSLHHNNDELWCTSLSRFSPGRYRVPPDTATWITPGPYLFTLIVWRDSLIMDSSIVGGISYQTGLSVDDGVYRIPGPDQLYQNYPNPFNGETTIAYHLSASGHVEIRVVDMLGRFIQMLQDSNQMSGSHVIRWKASNLASGSYFVVASFAEIQSVIRCRLMK
jgi:hypothetical protein